MRLEIKQWGNGIAVRLPRDSKEFGRLEPGMEIEVDIRPLKRARKNWKPRTFRSGIKDLSQRIDEVAWGFKDEERK